MKTVDGLASGAGTVPPCLLPWQRLPDSAAIRLLCFHHAGGAASSFATWQAGLGPDVAVVPVQLPGRERRVREPRFRDFDRLLDELDEQLDPLLDGHHAVYGHSLGGLIAHELTRRRVATGRRAPELLVVGACAPPHLPHSAVAPQNASDAQLTSWMRGLGGVPDRVARHPDWLRRSVELLRDDLCLVHSHPRRRAEALPVPLRVLAAESDPLLTPAQAREWARHTSYDFRVHTLPGGHFFHREHPEATLRVISQLLPVATEEI
ncbi:thioesterase II family protein [Streptomyces sp. Ag109_G2-15]|uniref:thioesterase II family protein n=1 Tax=Streptomyces sp. Ag109_G2-15 TaxID=1938850 RepID=UPI000BD0D834|nr:alpha/beta fold hydrolase [Streptomyces sp. Ag109_G2-15]SOD87001.1 Surfactin synthase thioesterase subunit [Streptomyces sp. Ag109_G2-15]